jgi:DNA mismatch repair ATPase MutS
MLMNIAVHMSDRHKSFVLFATHFKELAETLGPFPGVDM